MKKVFMFLMTLVFGFCVPIVTSAEITEEWVAIYDGPQMGYDEVVDMAVDSVGNVYVTGWTWNDKWSEKRDTDFVTIKYSPGGEKLWVNRYNRKIGAKDGAIDEPSAIVTDLSGNVYVTGTSIGEGSQYIITIKYDTKGERVWLKKHLGQSKDIAVDPNGNVYVAGNSLFGFLTIKYDVNGQQMWEREYTGNGFGAGVSDLAIDDAGNVYLTGYYLESEVWPQYYGYSTVKYDSQGNELWVRTFRENSNSIPTAISVDSSGNVYITGHSTFVVGNVGQLYYATIKNMTLMALNYGCGNMIIAIC